MTMKTGWKIKLTMTVSSFTCLIVDTTPPGASRATIDVSHTQTSGGREFIPGDLVDWGELKLTIGFDPSVDPPINADPEEIELEFRDGEVWTFMGFMTAYTPKAPMDDKMTAEVTIKVASKPEITPAV